MSNASLWSLLLGQDGLKDARSLFVHLHKDPHEAFSYIKFKQAHQLRNLLPALSSYHSRELAHINPASFNYLNDKQRKELIDKLIFMFYIFALEHNIHLTEDRKAKRIELEANLKHCSVLLYQLRESINPLTPKSQLNEATGNNEPPLHLLAYSIVAPINVEEVLTLINAQYQKTKRIDIEIGTGKIIEFLTRINLIRFGYVWDKSMLEGFFQVLPDDYEHKSQATQHINDGASAAGYISFILYYIRFSFNILVMLKHTVKGFWMSTIEENIELPTWEKFKTQWQQRKFSLLNDLIWGLANMACYLWLKGDGKLGYAGNIVCAGLLLMDLTLSIWRHKEEKAEYNRKITAIDDAQNRLKEIRINLKKILKNDDDTEKRALLLRNLEVINNKIVENDKLKEDIQFNWKYNRYQNINTIAYSASLLSGFTVMSGFLIPAHLLAHATLLTSGVVGGALCFILTTIYAAVTYAIEIRKLTESKKLIDEKLERLYKEFNAIQGSDEDSENQRKILFLQIQDLEAESAYTSRLITFQNLKLAKSIITNVLIPALVFIGLVFMPFGMGAVLVAASVLLIFLTNILVNRQAPKAPKLTTFDEKNYVGFKQKQIDLDTVGNKVPKKENPYGFYSKKPTVRASEEEAQPLLAENEFQQHANGFRT